jgi:hypothetical protein
LDCAASRTGTAIATNNVIAITHLSIRDFMLSPSSSVAEVERPNSRLYSFHFQGQGDVSAQKS